MRAIIGLGVALSISALGCGGGSDGASSGSKATVAGAGPGAVASQGSGGQPGSTATNPSATGHASDAGTASMSGPGTGGVSGAPNMNVPDMQAAAGMGGGAIGSGGSNAGNTAGMGGGSAGNTGGGIPPSTGGTDPVLPMPKGDCPTIATGSVSVMGATVQVWTGSGTDPGPIMIYWHGTGGVAATATTELDPTLVSEIMATGGVIISMESGGQGNMIDWGVYTTGDYDIVDQLVACSVAQLHIDPRRIYTGGASAGGLAAGTMAFARSSYLAAANPNSGGVAPWPGLNVFQDMMHIPAVLTMHGGDADMVVISFGQASLDLDNPVAAAGGFAVDCNHGGTHVGAPPDLKAAGWEFMKAHPFGTKPSPYAGGLPATFPSYCTIIGK